MSSIDFFFSLPALLLGLNFVTACLFMLLVYRLLKKKQVLDKPNDRSLHETPKLNGGGIAILAAYLVFMTVFLAYGYVSPGLYGTLLAGGVLLGVTGWFDDIRGLPVWLRLGVQFAAAVFLLLFFGGLTDINLLDRVWHIGIAGTMLAIPYTMWMINLYNFMDGIDGIALSQLILPSLFIGAAAFSTGSYGISFACISMVFSSVCFYRLNWPPSKMFMGDVLSGFLGFFFAALTVYLNNEGGFSVLLVPVLLSVFIFDATVTLLLRTVRGERIIEAHSRHIYQQFAKVYGHRPVTLSVMAINIALYAPALLIIHYPSFDLVITLAVYGVLALVLLILKRIFLKSGYLEVAPSGKIISRS